MRKIESRGAHEVAKRNKAVCAQIFSYSIQVGAAERNPVADMKDVLPIASTVGEYWIGFQAGLTGTISLSAAYYGFTIHGSDNLG